jgi:hypothetical protein
VRIGVCIEELLIEGTMIITDQAAATGCLSKNMYYSEILFFMDLPLRYLSIQRSREVLRAK